MIAPSAFTRGGIFELPPGSLSVKRNSDVRVTAPENLVFKKSIAA